MTHIQPATDLTSNDHQNTPITATENHFQRSPLNILTTIYSYFDSQTLLTFRLVRKMSPEQEKQYSILLNLHFIFSMFIQNLEALNTPIFSAFDTIRPNTQSFSYDILRNLSIFLSKQNRPLKGVNFSGIILVQDALARLSTSQETHPFLHDLPTLEHIYYTSEMTCLVPSLKKTKNLKTLCLKGAYKMTEALRLFTDQELLDCFQSLERLTLKYTDISTLQLSRLLKAIRVPLKSLTLSELKSVISFTDSLELDDFTRLFSSLEDLNLDKTLQQSDTLLTILPSCKSLKRLSLHSCDLSGVIGLLCNNIFTSTKRQEKLYPIFSSLRVLNLSLVNINSFCLQAILASCFSLRGLDLSCEAACVTIPGLRLNQIERIFSQLRRLSLARLPSSTKDREDFSYPALSRILLACQSLEVLNVSSCTAFNEVVNSFTSKTLHTIFAHVHSLNICQTNLDTTSFKKLLLAPHSLKTLILAAFSNLTQIIESLSAEDLNKMFCNLHNLDISYSPITGPAFVKLFSACPSLKEITLNNTSDCATYLLKQYLGQMYTDKHTFSYQLEVAKLIPHLSYLLKEQSQVLCG